MISDIEAVVLGLICEGFRYGYEIEKAIKDRNMRHWTEIAFSSIYYVLKRLEKQGLIEGSVEEVEGKPSRRVYRATAEGMEKLKEKLTSTLSHYEKVISPFNLGIGFLGLLGTDTVSKCLVQYLRSIDETVSAYHEGLQRIDRAGWPFYVKALYTRPIASLEAERLWVEGFVAEITDHGKKEGKL